MQKSLMTAAAATRDVLLQCRQNPIGRLSAGASSHVKAGLVQAPGTAVQKSLMTAAAATQNVLLQCRQSPIGRLRGAASKHVMAGLVQALWALAAVQKSLVVGRKQAAGAIMNTLKKHCTKSYNRKLYDQFPSLCDQLIRLCNHQPPAKAK